MQLSGIDRAAALLEDLRGEVAQRLVQLTLTRDRDAWDDDDDEEEEEEEEEERLRLARATSRSVVGDEEDDAIARSLPPLPPPPSRAVAIAFARAPAAVPWPPLPRRETAATLPAGGRRGGRTCGITATAVSAPRPSHLLRHRGAESCSAPVTDFHSAARGQVSQRDEHGECDREISDLHSHHRHVVFVVVVARQPSEI